MAQRWRRWRREPISKAIPCQAGFNLGRASRNKREPLACPRKLRSAVTPIPRGVSVCIPLKIATHVFEAISWLREPGALNARSRLLEAGHAVMPGLGFVVEEHRWCVQEIARLEAWALHHLQQQVRRSRSQVSWAPSP